MIDWIEDDLAVFAALAEQLADAPSLSQMGALGLADLCVPEAEGGAGQGVPALACVLEVVAQSDAGIAAALYGHGAARLAWQASGEPDDAGEPLASGLWWGWPGFHDIGRHDWPHIDSEGRVSGELQACLLGAVADVVVCPVQGPQGRLMLFRFSVHQPGVRRQVDVRFMGLRAAGIAHLALDRVSGHCQRQCIDADCGPLQAQLAVAVMAMLCGLMRASLQTAQAYAVERHQGGGPLLGWGEVRRLLAVQHERLLQAQAALSAALRALDSPMMDAPQRAARARALLLQTGQAATALAMDGVQLLGGNGYMEDYAQAQRLRDAWQLQGLMGPAAQRRQDLLGLCLID
ncbi:MAG: acyl-CoA/acyl-ACP dehydrogenase [Burkholderiales bacterium]|nr:acyl-CoA/acyl-ACP dehydrogenase [Burkholderiales bacterium]